MSNRIELLAILLSGFFPANRREKAQVVGEARHSDVMRLGSSEADQANERPTLRLLRLIGRHRDRPTLS
jgi:hypothetical protein